MTDGPCYADLRGKVALVTGAGTNIGRAIALRFAIEGCRLVICGRRAELLEETAALARARGGECAVVPADLSREADIDHLFQATLEAFGTLDVLVQNAAEMRMTLAQHVTLEQWDRSFATIARAAFLLARGAYAIMEPKREGVLLFISTVGALRAHHHGVPYDAAKAAVDGLVRNLACDYGLQGIRVNGIAPGATPPLAEGASPAPRREVPLGRNGTGADVAAAAAFLASRQASYITGQILYVDGGLTAQLTPRDVWV
ncbi:MAG: SDR family oxidoreductase [Armatimonadetes bacterium]|nr:SDR family oxidoreductase [Armatimonadota bacterium]